MSTFAQRLAMAQEIVNFEARRDSQGHLKVYSLPANDGGGKYEVAGINTRYNPKECAELVRLIEAGKYEEAEDYAVEFIAKDTDSAAKLTTIPAVEFYLRDCVFNRGATGAVKILQIALDVASDGEVGPDTRNAMIRAETEPNQLLADLRHAREQYELRVAGRRENLWKGLVNRWDGALAVAKKFTTTAPTTPSGGWMTLLSSLFRAIAAFWHDTSTGIPAKPTAPKSPPWMAWAEKEVGFHEKGQNLGIERYIGLAHCGDLGDPWCAIFVNAALESQNLHGTRSAMARSFERHPDFAKLAGPAVGAITTMWRQSPSSGLGHVFFYAGENDKGVLALGGNQSDKVCRQYENRNRIVGYYWPKSVPLPVTGAVTIVDTGETEGSET